MFVHGYSLFPEQSLSLMTHWASRGYVVVSPELTGTSLRGVLGGRPRGNPKASLRHIIHHLRELANALSAPAHLIDTTRIGVVGHSLGGELASKMSDNPAVKVIVAMAEDGTRRANRTYSSLIIGGTRDAIEPYAKQRRGYARSPRPKRFLGIRGAGHMSFTDLCGANGHSILAPLLQARVRLPRFVRYWIGKGCQRNTHHSRTPEIIRYATTAALDESLLCAAAATQALEQLPATFANLVEYESDLLAPPRAR